MTAAAIDDHRSEWTDAVVADDHRCTDDTAVAPYFEAVEVERHADHQRGVGLFYYLVFDLNLLCTGCQSRKQQTGGYNAYLFLFHTFSDFRIDKSD